MQCVYSFSLKSLSAKILSFTYWQKRTTLQKSYGIYTHEMSRNLNLQLNLNYP